MELQAFCDLLYPGAEEGWFALNFFPDKKTQWVKADDVDNCRIDLTGKNCYLGIGIRKQRLSPEKRGVASDVIAIPGLWVDLDFDDGNSHRVKNLPPSLDACIAMLDDAPCRPSLIVHSGHGLQAYWLFNEAWYFEDDLERQYAARLAKGWESWFQTYGKNHGWHVDSTADLARVFRIPGTFNYKTDPPVQARIIRETMIRYEPSDFDDWIEGDIPQPAPVHNNHIPVSDVLKAATIPDRLKFLIVSGDVIGKYPSRSEAVFAVTSGLIRAKIDDDSIISTLLNPDYRISEMPIERGQKWVANEIARVHKKLAMNGHHASSNGQSSTEIDGLQYDAKGKKVLENFYNMSLILENHKCWQGKIRFDSFRNRPMLDNNPVNDTTEFRILEWLGKHYQFGGNKRNVLSDAIKSVASKNEYDALLEWIDKLPKWDGIQRMDTWMIDLCGSEDCDYSRWVSKVTLLQMMNRALNPGCIARLIPIWNGAENQGKSTAVALLGGEWATTLKVTLESKEAHMAIHGYWIAELEELDTLYKTSEARLKAFLTNTSDHYVPKYSNHSVDYPRRTVFIGTTNDSDYLRGLTGNTRFLPINTGTFDLEAMKNSRDQLLSEAKAWLLENPEQPWWNEPDNLRPIIKGERESRRVLNVYEDDLKRFLAGEGGDNCFDNSRSNDYKVPKTNYLYRTTLEDIFVLYMKIDSKEKWKDTSLQRQVTEALKALGWYRKKSNSTNWWLRPDSNPDDQVPF